MGRNRVELKRRLGGGGGVHRWIQRSVDWGREKGN